MDRQARHAERGAAGRLHPLVHVLFDHVPRRVVVAEVEHGDALVEQVLKPAPNLALHSRTSETMAYAKSDPVLIGNRPNRSQDGSFLAPNLAVVSLVLPVVPTVCPLHGL